MAPLAFLLGRWAGEGEGEYPTIERFGYGEEMTFSHVGKPFLAYAQRSWNLDDGQPLHAETGYWRCPSPSHVELVVAHPNGLVEVSEGSVQGRSIELTSTSVTRTSSAKDVTQLVRALEVQGDQMTYRLDMAAVGIATGRHLQGVLRHVSAPPA
jgi:hypothetical protein